MMRYALKTECQPWRRLSACVNGHPRLQEPDKICHSQLAQTVQSKIQNVLPLVHLSPVIHTTEIHQFWTRKLPVPEQKVASSGTESCQFWTRKLPVLHSFARLLRTCMTTGRKKAHLTRPLVLPNLLTTRHIVREWTLVHPSSFIPPPFPCGARWRT